MPQHFQALALLSTTVYFAGLVYLKLAATAMPPLSGRRPWRLTRALLRSRVWLAGAAIVAVGAGVQAAALTRLTLLQAQPMLLAGLAVLVVLTVPLLGERLTLREWGCVVLLAAATALFAGAAKGVQYQEGRDAPERLVIAVAALSILVSAVSFLACDLARKGTHARPLTGVALAISVGVLTGTAELMLKGAGGLAAHLGDLVEAPYLYLFALTAPLALGQLQIALQRSRLVIVGLVATATAKTYLLLVGGLLFQEPWPVPSTTRFMPAVALSVLAVAAVPHHESAHALKETDDRRTTPAASGVDDEAPVERHAAAAGPGRYPRDPHPAGRLPLLRPHR
ncbi:hypothetical protein [Actinomadura darangshiensis]|uniref:hypothetical protein n=1 Tax=Actinomadura darangshiensis TaxID=705336 RepID=UPI001FB7F4A8|nr:hypothetical protein [Actinomadura darangshiensis]